MRWLFALLLLLNAGFFIWQYSVQKSGEAHSITSLALPPDNSIKSLVLLREIRPTALPGNTNTAGDKTSQATLPATVAPTLPCYTIGPFITAQEAQRASTLLEMEQFVPRLRAGGTLDNPEHWLDIGSNPVQPPPPASESLWQTLISTFGNIQQQPHTCDQIPNN